MGDFYVYQNEKVNYGHARGNSSDVHPESSVTTSGSEILVALF